MRQIPMGPDTRVNPSQKGGNHMTKIHRRATRKGRAVAVMLVTAVLIVGAASAAGAGDRSDHHRGNRSSYHGVFNETQAGADLGYDIHGSTKMTITKSGTTVKIKVDGLDPAKDYGSHLHNGTCASGGGGHYQDIEGAATEPPNELWLTTSGSILEPNPGGVAHAKGTAPWAARTSSTTQTNARSVVVHEPGGARIACADLT
jgi:hypothetical protein